MNEKAKFAVKLLREYADQQGVPARSTSDLSPLEQWLIIQLYEKHHMALPQLACENCGKADVEERGDWCNKCLGGK